MPVSNAKPQPKGQIKEGLFLSLAVSAGLFLGIAAGVTVLAIFKLSFTKSKSIAAASDNLTVQVNDDNLNLQTTTNATEKTTATDSPSSPPSAKQELADISDDQKKKINVFGYDIKQRTALADFLTSNKVSRIKANASVMIVAGKLINAAKSLEMTPDENSYIPFPKGTNFEKKFDEGTLMAAVDAASLPDVFVPLIEKYSKGNADPNERQLAFYVLAAFYLSEVK